MLGITSTAWQGGQLSRESADMSQKEVPIAVRRTGAAQMGGFQAFKTACGCTGDTQPAGTHIPHQTCCMSCWHAYLAKKVLHGQPRGLSCWAGAAAGGPHSQGLFLHDALVGGLQSQLPPAGLIVEGCQGRPCPPVALQSHSLIQPTLDRLLTAAEPD